MPKYEVILEESYQYILIVDAQSEDEALELGWDKLYETDDAKDKYESSGNNGESFAIEIAE